MGGGKQQRVGLHGDARHLQLNKTKYCFLCQSSWKRDALPVVGPLDQRVRNKIQGRGAGGHLDLAVPPHVGLEEPADVATTSVQPHLGAPETLTTTVVIRSAQSEEEIITMTTSPGTQRIRWFGSCQAWTLSQVTSAPPDFTRRWNRAHPAGHHWNSVCAHLFYKNTSSACSGR